MFLDYLRQGGRLGKNRGRIMASKMVMVMRKKIPPKKLPTMINWVAPGVKAGMGIEVWVWRVGG